MIPFGTKSVALSMLIDLLTVDRRRWRSHQLTSDLKRCLLFRKCLRWSSRKAVSVPTSVIGGLGAPQRPAILFLWYVFTSYLSWFKSVILPVCKDHFFTTCSLMQLPCPKHQHQSPSQQLPKQVTDTKDFYHQFYDCISLYHYRLLKLEISITQSVIQ